MICSLSRSADNLLHPRRRALHLQSAEDCGLLIADFGLGIADPFDIRPLDIRHSFVIGAWTLVICH
jgi:hypothetical protein